MITSTSLFQEVTTTELVQMKDAVDVQVERLLMKYQETNNAEERHLIGGWHRNKSDLSFKLSAIIEARLEEAKRI